MILDRINLPEASEIQALAVRSVVNIPPWLLVVVAVFSVQLGAAVAKQLFDAAGPGGVVFLRTSLSGIMFMLLWRPHMRSYSRRSLIGIVLYGVSIAAMMLSFYAAIERIPLGIAVAVAFAGPLGLAVLGSRRLVDVLWVALAAVGVLLLTPLASGDLDATGVLLSGVSGICWVVFIVMSRRVNQSFSGNAALALGMCIAALAALPFGIGGAAAVFAGIPLILLSVFVALLSSAIPFALEYQALKRLEARTFGLLISLEPVVATLVGYVVLREALGLREMIGIGLVTIAAAATARSSSAS